MPFRGYHGIKGDIKKQGQPSQLRASLFGCGMKRILILREFDLVFGVLLIPHTDEVVAGLADVLAVENPAAEGTGHVQAVGKGGVGAERNGDAAAQVYIGREGAKPFHFYGAACAAAREF